MDRREFIAGTTLGTMSMSFDNLPSLFKEIRMGIVVHSYASRWNSKTPSEKYPGFANAIDLLEHCAKIGAGGIQVGVKDWTMEFANKVRDRREKLGLYLEGSIALPTNSEDVVAFEKEVVSAREAGADILRTVCLNGRRYENFKSREAFEDFRKRSLASIELASPIVQRHKVKLAIENHKDWRAGELADLMKKISSEWMGVTLDFGNNVALMEEPMEVVQTLLPYLISTHVKDMGVEEYAEGFLLSEVPLGEGIVDLPKVFSLCRSQNPNVRFNLEMITRDPLQIPCLRDQYWSTFEGIASGRDLAQTLRMVREKKSKSPLPRVSQLTTDEKLAVEEKNIRVSLTYSEAHLNK
jgi:sugar phosphate isomerase/epimerase